MAKTTAGSENLKDLLEIPAETLSRMVKKERWRRNPAAFIKEAVMIEDRDLAGKVKETGIAINFSLWPDQEKALQDLVDSRLSIVLKARQVGFTWLALALGLHGLVFSSGFSCVALSQREDPDVKELARRMRFMLEHLPDWLACPKGDKERREKAIIESKAAGMAPPVMWEDNVMSCTVTHYKKLELSNGVVRWDPDHPSKFQSMTSSPGSGRSFTANLVILDEWALQQYAREIWDSAYPTVNRPTGGKVIGLSTFQPGTFFEEMWKNASLGINSFKPIFLSVWSDPRRTEDWYEKTKKDMPNTFYREYPQTPEEAMSAGEGTAFPEFARSIHVCKDFEPPAWWKRWRSNDPGYTDPFAWYWFTVSEDGIVYVYREYTRSPNEERLPYSEQAKRVAEMSYASATQQRSELAVFNVLTAGIASGERELPKDPGRIAGMEGDVGKAIQQREARRERADRGEREPEKFQFTVAGRDAFNKHPETGKAIIDYYNEGGLGGFIEPVRDRRIRKATLHEYLKPYYDEQMERTTAKLQIMEGCKKIIESLPQLIVDPRDPEKVKESGIDHWYDALGYGLCAWHSTATPENAAGSPGRKKSAIEADKDRLAKNMARNLRKRMIFG